MTFDLFAVIMFLTFFITMIISGILALITRKQPKLKKLTNILNILTVILWSFACLADSFIASSIYVIGIMVTFFVAGNWIAYIEYSYHFKNVPYPKWYAACKCNKCGLDK